MQKIVGKIIDIENRTPTKFFLANKKFFHLPTKRQTNAVQGGQIAKPAYLKVALVLKQD